MSLVSIAFPQITITQNDMPNVGDTMRFSTGLNISGYDFTTTGNNYTWDFSELTPVIQSVDTFVSVGSTPFWYQLVFIYPLVATIAKPLGEFDQVPSFQATDIFEFYKETASSFSLAGYAVTLNSVPLPVKFQTPDFIYKFPMNPGNEDSCTSSYEIDIPGIGYVGGWKKRHNYIDGWGTLKTPFGQFQTLRVKSVIVQFDSLYVDSLNTGFPLSRNFTEYKWLGSEKGQPLLQYTNDGIAPTIVYMDSIRNLIVDVRELNHDNDNMFIYPNPAGDFFQVDISKFYGSKTDITLFDLNGKVVMENKNIDIPEGSNELSISITCSNLNPGLYTVRLYSKGEYYYEKLLIQ